MAWMVFQALEVDLVQTGQNDALGESIHRVRPLPGRLLYFHDGECFADRGLGLAWTWFACMLPMSAPTASISRLTCSTVRNIGHHQGLRAHRKGQRPIVELLDLQEPLVQPYPRIRCIV